MAMAGVAMVAVAMAMGAVAMGAVAETWAGMAAVSAGRVYQRARR